MMKRLAAVAAARAAGPRASGVRSHVLSRLAAVVMSFVVTMNIGAPVASARVFDNLDNTPLVVWAQYDAGTDTEHGFVGNCYNQFTAALTALGYNRSQLTSEMETKLSNADTGGRFFEFSQSLSNGYTDIDSLPGWTPTLIAGYIWSASVIGGNSTWDSLWSWEVSKELFDGAKADLLTVMSGGSLGGGGGTYDYYVAECSVQYTTNYRASMYPTVTTTNCVTSSGASGNSPYQVSPKTVTVQVNGQYVEDLIATASSRYHIQFDEDNIYCAFNRWRGGETYIEIILFKDGTYTDSKFVSRSQTFGSLSNTYLAYNGFSITSNPASTGVLIQVIYFNTTSDVVVYDGDFSSIGIRANNSDYSNGKYAFGKFSGGSGGSGGGTNNWPDDDEGGGSDDEPREPEVPDPDPTPVPDPDPIDQPTWPDPDPIDDPVGGGGTTINYSPPTDTTVIENWLAVIYQAIVDGFNSVTDDMETHCKHIQSKLNTVYENLVSMIGKYISAQTESINNNLSNQVWWLARQIDGQFDELKDYLHDLAEWLADQLDFEVNVEGNGYDDTSIVSWLKKIYAKLGNGGANSRPVDPVVNDDDWWEWLLRALQNWTAGLILNANDLISNLGDLLSRLISRFPFGIPFMTLDVITLLAADPVTPEFDLSYQIYQTEVSYNVDLEPFNDAAATVRAMEYLIFGGFLLMKTPKVISEMMGVFD